MRALSRAAALVVVTTACTAASAEGPAAPLGMSAYAQPGGLRLKPFDLSTGGIALRLALAVAATPGSPLAELPIRPRLLSGMVDFFPLGGDSGFHLSGGTLRAYKTRMGVEAEWLNPSRLVAVRIPGNSTFHGNARRSTPTMSLGYSVAPSRNFNIGLEVGEAMGRLNSMGPGRSFRRFVDHGGDRPGRSGGLNPIVHLAAGLRF